MIRWTFRCKCDYSGAQLQDYLEEVRDEACGTGIAGQIVSNEGGLFVIAEGGDSEVESLIDSIMADNGTGDYLTHLIEYNVDSHFSTFREFSENIGYLEC